MTMLKDIFNRTREQKSRFREPIVLQEAEDGARVVAYDDNSAGSIAAQKNFRRLYGRNNMPDSFARRTVIEVPDGNGGYTPVNQQNPGAPIGEQIAALDHFRNTGNIFGAGQGVEGLITGTGGIAAPNAARQMPGAGTLQPAQNRPGVEVGANPDGNGQGGAQRPKHRPTTMLTGDGKLSSRGLADPALIQPSKPLTFNQGAGDQAGKNSTPASTSGTLKYAPDSLITTESGGNFAAKNDAVGAGGKRGHFGRVQFGHARFGEAKAAGAVPKGMSIEEFGSDTPQGRAAQKSAEEWHFKDINNYIDSKGLAAYENTIISGVVMTRDGMIAMAHLGGKAGMRKFLETDGAYDPADTEGTTLSYYALRHSGLEDGEHTPPDTEGGDSASLQSEDTPPDTELTFIPTSGTVRPRLGMTESLQFITTGGQAVSNKDGGENLAARYIIG